MSGWILVHRQICDNGYLWNDKPFARGQAWIDLLLITNFTETDEGDAGEELVIRRGQYKTTIRKLAERWGWSRTKVSDFLNSLQSSRMAKIESDKKKTVITIANYDFYQDVKDKKKTNSSRQGDTEKTPSLFNKQCKETNTLERESERVKNKAFTPPTLDEIKAYCKERGNDVSPERFHDYFTASGWVDSLGKKVRNWKQKIITWERNASGAKPAASNWGRLKGEPSDQKRND